MTTVKLLTSDDQEVEVPRNYVTYWGTVEHTIGDAPDMDVVPVPNVSTLAMNRVVKYTEDLLAYQNAQDALPEEERRSKTEIENDPTLMEWEKPHVDDLPVPELFELILASNYLEFSELLDATCKKTAAMIKGKNPDEIRKTFNLPKPGTESSSSSSSSDPSSSAAGADSAGDAADDAADADADAADDAADDTANDADDTADAADDADDTADAADDDAEDDSDDE